MDVSQEKLYLTPYSTSPLLPLLLVTLATQRHAPKTSTTFLDEYDYIIVGAGSAGSVVANRLSEDPRVNVLLLEAGKSPPRQTEIPAIPRYFLNTDIDWKYLTTPQRYTAAGLVDRRVPWPSGKTLGGSSVLNAMLYVRGNRRNYDEWAEMGAKGWSYEEVLPYFKKLEDNMNPEYVASGYHARGGPVTASKPDCYPIKKVAAMEAARNEGYIFVNPNGPEQNGFFDHQGSIREGQRCSTAKAYLVPAENRTNLNILPNAMVKKVLIENKRAVGVEFDYDNTAHKVKAKREVILSAGTTNTAQLLMLSGIGPLSELKKFDIPVVADLPVGLNFQDHPASFLIYEVNDNIPQFDIEIRENINILHYMNGRKGPLTCTEGIELMSFLSSSENGMEGLPDHSVYITDFVKLQYLQIGMTPELIARVLIPSSNKSLITCASQLLRTRSIGSVSLQSADPYDPPVIDPNFFADFRDVEDVVQATFHYNDPHLWHARGRYNERRLYIEDYLQGLKVCHKILSNPAVKRIGARPLDKVIPGCEEFVQDLNMYIRCIVRTLVVTTSHQVGTAKMGDPRDPSTVVDPQLRVKGVNGLRVVDASVMPTIPWSNTNIPTIMIAEKASDIIKRDLMLY